jgi:hypothetical protein
MFYGGAHWKKCAILASKFYNSFNFQDKAMIFEMKILEYVFFPSKTPNYYTSIEGEHGATIYILIDTQHPIEHISGANFFVNIF